MAIMGQADIQDEEKQHTVNYVLTVLFCAGLANCWEGHRAVVTYCYT